MEFEVVTVIGKSLTINVGLKAPGGFLLEAGGTTAIQYTHRPRNRVIENYRLMLGWIWIDVEDTNDSTNETNGDRPGQD